MLFEDPVEERDLTEDSYNRELIARALTPTTSEYLATFDEKQQIFPLGIICQSTHIQQTQCW